MPCDAQSLVDLTANRGYSKLSHRSLLECMAADAGDMQGVSPGSVPSQATTPSPANGVTGVSLTPTLSWANGGGATTYNVWFNGVEVSVGQAGTTYAPAALSTNTVYSWRVDSVNAAGTTTGVTWGFTTEAALPFFWSPPTSVCSWVDSGGSKFGDYSTFQGTADIATVTDFTAPQGAGVTAVGYAVSLPSLRHLTLDMNPVDSLDLSGCVSLETVHANNLGPLFFSLDISYCTALTFLGCGFNSFLTSIIGLPTCTAMVTLTCPNCDLQPNLDVTGLTVMTNLSCSTNANLGDITGLPTCISLQHLSCANCFIGSTTTPNPNTLYVGTLTQLLTLDCSANYLLDIDGLKNCTLLTSLICGVSGIGSASSATPLLDVGSPNPLVHLVHLECEYNIDPYELAAVNLTGCTNVSYLNLQGDPSATPILTTVDISSNTALGANPSGFDNDVEINNQALTTSAVDSILHYLSLITPAGSIACNLSGQTPPAYPSAQGLLDKGVMSAKGWNVTTD